MIRKSLNYVNNLRSVGYGMAANPIALTALPVALSGIIVSSLFSYNEIQSAVFWVPLLFLAIFFAGAALVAWMTTPLWGLYYLWRVKCDYGPKTRSKVLDWFSGQIESSGDAIHIEQLALEAGELVVEKNQHSLQPSNYTPTDELAYDDIMGASRELNVILQDTVNKFSLTESQFIEALKIATNGVVSSERLHGGNKPISRP